MKEEDIKKLYQDAVFLNLIKKGYSKSKAEMKVKKWVIMERID
jgi:hypothetical protein